MDFTLTLLGLALYTLIWEKLPDWGNWFNWIIERLPRPLAYLYEAWRCPFCFGFWAALTLHALTGLTTVSGLDNLAGSLSSFGIGLAWFLDALATAMLIMILQLGINALSGPAINGFRMTKEFRQTMLSDADRN